MVPGPGTYKMKDVLGSEGTKWSMRVKPAKRANSIQPGPGAYESPKGLVPEGKYYWSKYKDSGNTALKTFSKRFIGEGAVEKNPGPGQYKEPNTINPDGRNFVSKFGSSYSRTFAAAERKIDLGGGNKSAESFFFGGGHNTNVDTPGPGSYRFPSEFGVYEAVEDFKGRRKYSPSSKVLKKAGEATLLATGPTKTGSGDS